MILDQKPARLDYTKGSETKSIYYDRDGFEGSDQEVAEKLRAVFESDSVDVVAGADIKPLTDKRVFAPKAISLALDGYSIDAGLRARLKDFAETLPPLMVRFHSMQQHGFHDNGHYMKMHMKFLKSNSFNMREYLSEAENTHDETVRLRVLMATYTLGLIAPLNTAITTAHGKHRSIFSPLIDNLKLY